ncbi:MAG: type II secretion system protein [Patescibacteria group bacterium]
MFKTANQYGFTLVELLTVMGMLVMLATIILVLINPSKMLEQARTAAAYESLAAIAKAAHTFSNENGYFPSDVNRNLPQEFIEYLSPGAWPNGPFPGSVYDWDNWETQTCWDGSTGIIQVTLRQINGYQGKNNYTIYYVIQGIGVPHCSTTTVKGKCINCDSRYP